MVLLFQGFLPVPMVEVNCVPRSGLVKMTCQASGTVLYGQCKLSKCNLFGEETELVLLPTFFLYSLSVGFDLISQFQIERAASRRTVQRVVGSTTLQVAYKLGSDVDFRIPTR